MSEESMGVAGFEAIKKHLKRARESSEYRVAVSELQAAIEELEHLDVVGRHDFEKVVWGDYAIIASHFGDVKTAIEYEEKIVGTRPDDPYGYLSLGRLYGEIGDGESASASLRRCAELAERANDKKVLAALAAKGYLPDDHDLRARRLAEAVEYYRETLGNSSLKSSPERYAGAQQAVASLSRAQADLQTGTARTAALRQAAEAYREALRVYAADDHPDENRALRASLEDIEDLLRRSS